MARVALPDSIHRVSRSLAWLKVEAKGSVASGTAFVAGRSGELLTCAHLVSAAERLEVVFIGAKAPSPCVVLDTDARADVALLKCEARGLEAVSLWRGAPVALGREVAFMGFPHADMFQPPLVMTMRGIVGNRYRFDPGKGAVEFYVIDASASEGMSGGPVFLSDSGDVIGIVGGRFDPGRTRARQRGASPESLRELPAERTNIMFAPVIEYGLALLKRGR